MESECPIGNLSRKADNFSILSRDLRGVGGAAGQEVEIKHAANNVVLEALLPCLVGELDVHSVGVEKEYAMRARGTMFEIHRVVAV